MLLRRLLVVLLIAPWWFIASQCSPKKKSTALAGDSLVKYATGFSIHRGSRYTDVIVSQPFPGATSRYHYRLVPKGAPVPPAEEGITIIPVPVSRIVCTSTTHIPLLEYIGHGDALVGFPTTDYVSSPTMRQRIDAGQVTELGIDKGMNIEQLYQLHPDVVMGYSLSADLGQLNKIQSLGIPVVLNAEYLEKHPLGRAEWIRFMALLFDEEDRADSVFTAIEKSYLEVREQAAAATKKPTVLSGILYGNSWFLPGGKNYAATLLTDAGCQYLWADDSTSGFLELSFEHVFSKGREADLWLGTGNFETLTDLAAADRRYALFTSYKTGEIYHFNAHKGARGGNEYLELGYLRPDIILKDLVSIAHPELLPGYQRYFFQRLR